VCALEVAAGKRVAPATPKFGVESELGHQRGVGWSSVDVHDHPSYFLTRGGEAHIAERLTETGIGQAGGHLECTSFKFQEPSTGISGPFFYFGELKTTDSEQTTESTLTLPRPALRPYLADRQHWLRQPVSTGSVSPRRQRHRHIHNRQDALKVRTHSRCGIMVLKYSRAGSKGPHKQSEAQDDRGPTTLGSRWSPAISLALGSETPHPTVASPIAAAPD
jgi:hypothetical protein